MVHHKTKVKIGAAEQYLGRAAAIVGVLVIGQVNPPALLGEAAVSGLAGQAGRGQARQPVGEIIQWQAPAQQRLAELFGVLRLVGFAARRRMS